MAKNTSEKIAEQQTKTITVKAAGVFEKSWIVKVVTLTVIFSILTVSLAWVIWVKAGKISKSDFSNEVKYIHNEEEFVSYMIRNSIVGSLNARYSIESNLTLEKEHIEELENAEKSLNHGLWFYGKLEGRGNTITIAEKMDHPLFEQITEGSFIGQINIANIVIDGTQSNGGSIACLAYVNYGEITDIAVTKTTIDVGTASNAAALVNYNYGVIKNCLIQIDYKVDNKFVTTGGKIDAVWRCRVGSIVTHNGSSNGKEGKIEDIIVFAKFPENFAVLAMPQYNTNGDINLLISYTVGVWSNSEKLNKLYVVDAQYASTTFDFMELEEGISSISQLSIRQKDSKWNSWGQWIFSDNSLPKLRTT